jgi:hypothetical protein
MNNKVNVFNMTLPAEGPVTVPVNQNMADALEYEIDLTQMIEAKWVSYFSGVYIDNSANDQPLTILVNSTYQSVTFPANKQGWVPLLVPNPPVFTLSQAVLGGLVKLQFVNFPVWPYIIDDSGTGGTAGAPTFTRSSGPEISEYSIAALGGASEELIAAGDAQSYLFVYNPVGNADITINIAGGDADMSGMVILAGGSFELQNGLSNAVTVTGTIGETVIAFGGA